MENLSFSYGRRWSGACLGMASPGEEIKKGEEGEPVDRVHGVIVAEMVPG